jgi:hypothetical protein
VYDEDETGPGADEDTMTTLSDELRELGGTTAAENIRRAVEAGKLIEHADGTLELPPSSSKETNWVFVARGTPPRCLFLKNFLFRKVYGRAAVPYGCRECYKVHVTPKTLRELVAAWQVAKGIACPSKWGVNFENPYSRNYYAGVFYTTGVDMARAVHATARAAFDGVPALGPGLELAIKRACSEYEEAIGPSDRFEFAPELEQIEALLKTRFRGHSAAERTSVPLARWIDVASRIGDDTYLDFTNGKRLRVPRVTYEP